MKKVLFVANHSSHGGSLKMFTWLANALSDEYDICYCNLSGTAPFYNLKKEVNYIELNSKKSNSFLERNTVGFIKNIVDLVSLVRKNHYELVVNFSDHALYALLIVKMITGVKILVSQRVDPFSAKKRTERLRMRLYRFCDGLVCQTDSAEKFFDSARYNKLEKKVIPNPSLGKTNLKWNPEENKGYIVCVARVDLEQKRQDVLIDAMERVHRAYPDIKLRMYGKDVNNSIARLQDMIKEKELDDVVTFCGVTDNVYEVLCQARMMVLSSDYEGIPNAIIEAMEVGIPIISTDCEPGGARMLLEDGKGGIIVERGNSAELAEAIIGYLNHPQDAVAKAEYAHRSLYRFDEKRIVDEWKVLIARM